METRALRLGYGLIPLVAGADKFTNLLVDWEKYVSPLVRRMLPMKPSTLMRLVGVVEMVVGVGVLLGPTRKISARIAGVWLLAITGELLTNKKYFDIAARDALLAIGAFALGARQLQPELQRKDGAVEARLPAASGVRAAEATLAPSLRS